jgi:deoxyribonuclease V
MIHDWNVTPTEAIALQNELRQRLVLHPPEGFAPRLVGGADVSMDRDSPTGYAGIVAIDRTAMETLEEVTATVTLGFPYIPGLLSFRELPALQAAWDKLSQKPDVLIFDGAGYAHPRRFGLACHGGLLWDVPSIGCAKTWLLGSYDEPGEERGATSELRDKGEVIGMVVRLRTGVKPVFISAGHRMDLPTAVQIVLSMSIGFREPETTRRAHRLVNTLRRAESASVQ